MIKKDDTVKRLILVFIFVIFAYYQAFSQNVIKVHKSYIAIDPKVELTNLDVNLKIQRLIHGNIIEIGIAKYVRKEKGKIFAKIVKENFPYTIQKGDFVEGYAPEKKINVQLDANEKVKSDQEQFGMASKTKFRLNLEYGQSKRMINQNNYFASGFKGYDDRLTSGSNISLDATYFISYNTGIGLKYTVFNTSHRANNAIIFDEDTYQITGMGSLNDEISISFYGIGLVSKFLERREKLAMLASFMTGLFSYKNNSQRNNVAVFKNSNSIGLNGTISIDYRVSDIVAFGISASYTLGWFSSIKENGKKIWMA